MTYRSITVFTTPTWPACVHLKEYLSEKGVSYSERNVAEDDTARKEMIDKTQSMAVPTSIINGEIVIGFDRAKIEKLLQ